MLKSIVLSYLFVSGFHTAGHFVTADTLNVDVHLDIATMTEKWTYTDERQSRLILGGGFSFQDYYVSGAQRNLRAQEMRSLYIANALYKGVYALNVFLPRIPPKYGDYNRIDNYMDRSYAKEIFFVSLASDVLNSFRPETTWRLLFGMSGNGTPMLVFFSPI